MTIEKKRAEGVTEEDPPFGIWAYWYLAVVLSLIGMIVLSYLVTVIYS